jgi:hypothetical protein
MATIIDTTNASFQLAADFVNYTQASIFLTGKAGTGKTTFLRHCKENEKKNTAIVAPTGVAAINAGGTTIHSFFQLPFTPFVPESRGWGNSEQVTDKNSLIAKLKLTNDRKEVMQQLELLIIDEISMVRCDVLDAIDTVLRHVRSRHSQPFGGVQVLLIGDMYQLPPVAREEEWQLLSPYYKSPYFFNSQVMEMQPPVYVELDKIYRQKDERFVQLLNKVRNNEMDKTGFDLLHSRYQPKFNPTKEENYITLTTHNNKADAINNKALNELNGSISMYKATITGDFSEKAYPADVELRLKLGAQVMFIKNDVEKVRRYFNGRIGVVTKLEAEKISVLCNGDTVPIDVRKESWKNIRYAVDKTTNHIEENELGSFSQYPLRLAWAITIHKSQGLTFEKAIIDAGDAFAPGQVYVALSRCTSLEGMVLHSHIQNSSLHSDSRISNFAQLQKTSSEQLHVLHEAKRQFQNSEIISLFDFTHLQKDMERIIPMLSTQLDAFNKEALPWILDVEKMIDNVQAVSNKFSPQLQELLQPTCLPEKNEALQKRLLAAGKHFSGVLQQIKDVIQQCPIVTDSKLIASDFNKLMNELYKKIHHCLHLIDGLQNGFEIEAFMGNKRSFQKPSNPVNIYAGKATASYSDSPHPELHQLLRRLRDLICDETGLPVYRVANSKTLEELVTFLPQSNQELAQISGFGMVRVKQFGERFLSIINNYCEENNMHGNMEVKPAKRERKEKNNDVKTDTKQVSFSLYKEGKNVEEIAATRSMTADTIIGHLTYWIGSGELDINELMTSKKQITIKQSIEKYGSESLKPIVENNVDAGVSYGDVRMVLASMKAPL